MIRINELVSGIVCSSIISAILLTAGTWVGVTATVSKNVLLPGTVINDLDVGKKTISQAKTDIMEYHQKEMKDWFVMVSYRGKIYTFNAAELNIGTDSQTAADGYFNDYETTPSSFKKLQALLAIRSNADSFKVNTIVDEQVLRNKIMEFADSVMVQPIDASAKYDQNSGTFEYASEKAGFKIDTELLFNDLKNAFVNGDDTPIVIQEVTAAPNIDKEDVIRATALIGSFETTLTSNADRNINIALVTHALDGLVIKPGDTLSINDLVGERTKERGFRPAPSIVDGSKIVNDYGGGICQVTSTLYNAVLLANLEIVERHRHSWPANYLPIGQDAMVDWPDKDFAFKNTTQWPIYISAKIEGNTLSMKVFGCGMEDGSEVKIETEIIKTYKPSPKEYISDTSIMKGKTVYEVQERIGYRTRTLRNYYADNILVRSEVISEDNYPAVQGVVRVGIGYVTK